MQPIVSIITPTYNHQRFISECIRSVIGQTFRDWEMLIVNDGSTDSTAETASGFVELDPRIRLFNRENVGILRLAETYNYALGLAKGKYIAILEGDDVWEHDKLARQVKALESDPGLILAWGTANVVDAERSKVYYSSPDPASKDARFYNNRPPGSILNVLFFTNCIPALTLLIRKDALDDIGGFQQGHGLPLIDLPTLHQLCVRGPFYFDRSLLGSWRIYPGQTTKRYVADIVKGFRDLALENFNRFTSLPGVAIDVDERKLRRHFRRAMIVAYSRDGRYKLIRKEFKAARRDYIKSMFSPGGEYVWKLRSLTGWLFSFAHLDIEGLAKLLHRPTYQD